MILPTIHNFGKILPRITPFCCCSRTCCTRCRSVCKCGILYAGIMTIQRYAHFACTCISREKKCLIMHLEHSHLPRGNMHVDKTLLHPLLHLSLPILLVFIRLLWHGCITWQCEIETIRGKQLIQCKKKGVNYLFGSIRDG